MKSLSQLNLLVFSSIISAGCLGGAGGSSADPEADKPLTQEEQELEAYWAVREVIEDTELSDQEKTAKLVEMAKGDEIYIDSISENVGGNLVTTASCSKPDVTIYEPIAVNALRKLVLDDAAGMSKHLIEYASETYENEAEGEDSKKIKQKLFDTNRQWLLYLVYRGQENLLSVKNLEQLNELSYEKQLEGLKGSKYMDVRELTACPHFYTLINHGEDGLRLLAQRLDPDVRFNIREALLRALEVNPPESFEVLGPAIAPYVSHRWYSEVAINILAQAGPMAFEYLLSDMSLVKDYPPLSLFWSYTSFHSDFAGSGDARWYDAQVNGLTDPVIVTAHIAEVIVKSPGSLTTKLESIAKFASDFSQPIFEYSVLTSEKPEEKLIELIGHEDRRLSHAALLCLMKALGGGIRPKLKPSENLLAALQAYYDSLPDRSGPEAPAQAGTEVYNDFWGPEADLYNGKSIVAAYEFGHLAGVIAREYWGVEITQ